MKVKDINFIYMENGIEKTSIDENKRQNYIDELNRQLQNNFHIESEYKNEE